jgi:subtilase family serine protease
MSCKGWHPDTEKVGDGVRTSIETVTESTKLHIFPIATDSMRAEASKLQTQEKKITMREAEEHGGYYVVFLVITTNYVEQEDYVSCFLCGKIGKSRAQIHDLNGLCTN